MTNTATATPSSSPPPRVVALLGLDAKGKPHGAAFGFDDVEPARRAAALGGLHVLDLDGNDELRGLADKLPKGRIFASGLAFAPFVGRELFEGLCHAGGVTADQLATLRDSLAAAKAAEQAAAAPSYHQPTDWDGIALNSLVLATLGTDRQPDGWWEASVVEQDGADGTLTLRFRDYPELEPLRRRRDQLGLLPRPPAGEV